MRITVAIAVLGIAMTGCTARAPLQMTEARAAAIHDCSVAAAKYSYTSYQSTQIIIYDKCMFGRGQVP